MMKFIFKMLFLLLFLVSCGGKKVSTEKQKTTEKERKEIKKDSVSEVKNEVKTAEFSFEKEQSFEMEIVSDKEKDSVIYERIRSPTTEKIIVRGGSLKFKTTHHTADKIIKKDTLMIKQASLHTDISENKTFEKKEVKKEKETSSVRPTAIKWIILLLAIIFIAWRPKLFRIFSAFKNLLNCFRERQ